MFVFFSMLFSDAFAKKPPELRLDKGKPTSYALNLDLDPSSEQFSGTVQIAFELEDPSRDLWLHASGLDIQSASLDVGGETRAVRVAQQEEQFTLFKWRGKVEGAAVLTIDYTGSVEKELPRGVFHREDDGNHYLFTQFEPESARAMVPSFDQPQFKVPWSLTIRVPDGSEAYANTPLLERKDDGDYDVFIFERTLPLPTYLISVAAGPFDVVDGGTAGRAQTPIRYLVPKGDADLVDWAVETTGPILTWLEDYFNQPYSYRKLDVVGIPNLVGFGAMEHPGLITFNAQILLAEAQTDTIGRRRSYVTVQAHELAHQWFGNLVTMEWWDDIWLHEGFASWMANKAAGDLYPEWKMEYTQVARRASAMSSDSLESARQIR